MMLWGGREAFVCTCIVGKQGKGVVVVKEGSL